MPTFGLTPAGFVTKTADDLTSDLNNEIKGKLGESVSVELDTTVLGVWRGTVVRQAALLWQLGQAIYSAFTLGASGVALDNVLQLRGAVREEESASSATCVCVGTNGTVLTIGRRIKNAVTATFWKLLAQVTITTATNWAASTAYVVGNVRKNGSNLYYCITAGTSAGAGGPTGTGTDITDGSVHWRYVGAGSAFAMGSFESEDKGVIIGAAGDLSIIDTAVSGWDSVTNPIDAIEGQSTETDEAARVRSEAELRRFGATNTGAIRSQILAVPGVTHCTMFENYTNITDADGLPAKSVEAVVRGGADQDIINAIGKAKAAGIEAHGTNVTGTYTDSEGKTKTIKFTRPTVKDVWFILDIEIIPDLVPGGPPAYPVDGDTQLKQALADYGDTKLTTSSNVIASQFYRPTFGIAGIERIASFKLGFSNPPTLSADLVIGKREVADIDTGRISINKTNYVDT